MRKIRIFEHISLDGVIEHDGDYTYGAWTTPYRTPAGAAMLFEAYGPNFDLLLARHTYDIFSGFWPKAGDFPMANAINAATKYIVTHRPDGLEWGPVKGLSGNAAERIRELKSTDGPDLIVVGDRRSNEDFLRLPHPRAHERAFVLQPWHDLEPDAVFPERGPIADLLKATDASGVRKREDLSLEMQ